MKVVNVQQAKTHLSRLIEEAVGGEHVIIARAGRPQVRLTPCLPDQAERQPGDWKGKLWMAEDFDLTDPQVVQLFEQGDEPLRRPAARPRRAPVRKPSRRR